MLSPSTRVIRVTVEADVRIGTGVCQELVTSRRSFPYASGDLELHLRPDLPGEAFVLLTDLDHAAEEGEPVGGCPWNRA